ncbi:MAG TPA: TlpA disulfide reductase family protein [Thiobacillaceae bacterium]|nr:TlpA disulfide reductase family protein [Thiobacillaceae bacterium]HNU63787.1 TlpA disulfide reductase family protein [Thiobacillaceae bacterium]
MGAQSRTLVVLSMVAAGLATSSWFAAHKTGDSTQSGGVGAPQQVRSAQVWESRLPGLDNREQALRQWRGKVMVLNFWATWCPPCLREIPGFKRLQQHLGPHGLQIVGVALDDADKARAFATRMDMPYPVLLGGVAAMDLGRAAGNPLGGLPYTAVFDRQGRCVATQVGEMPEARLRAIVEPLL